MSFGYHADDGLVYSRGSPRDSGWPTYGRNGDVIGCGVNMTRKKVFFTRNGQFLGYAADIIPEEPYPVVGIITKGVSVDVNFGQDPFIYDPRVAEV